MSCIVSIIIPCYNHGVYIEETIQSIEESAGSYTYEVIIVDDGSSDTFTLQVLSGLVEKGYNILQQKNQGLAAARNNGIALARGKYILPLDSDNKIDKNYLSKAVEVLEEDDTIDVVYGDALFFGESDKIRSVGLRKVGKFDFAKMLYANYIDACALIRKSTWSQVGGYDGNMPAMGHEDWEMWVSIMLLGGSFYYLDEVGFYYRVADGSMLATNAEIKHNLNKEYIYKKHCHDIINWLLNQVAKFDDKKRYIENNKVRSAVKLLLGYKIQ